MTERAPADTLVARPPLRSLVEDLHERREQAKLGGGDYGYVAQLEASEDRMLEAFNDTLTDQDTPATVRTAVQSYLPQVKAQHDLMRDKKWAMESSRH